MISAENKAKWLKYAKAAIKGGCDIQQAMGIADERTLLDIMSASASIANMRDRIAGNVVRNRPR